MSVFSWEENIYSSSLNGYFTPAEVARFLGNLTDSFCCLVRSEIADKTFLKKIQYDEFYTDEELILSEQAGVLISAGHSSQQPLAVTQTLYTLAKLANLYAVDDSTKYLLESQRLYFLPMINRDAYQALNYEFEQNGQIGK